MLYQYGMGEWLSELNEVKSEENKVAVYKSLYWLVISQHSFSPSLIGLCEGYAWVCTQAESVCARELFSHCYIQVWTHA